MPSAQTHSSPPEVSLTHPRQGLARRRFLTLSALGISVPWLGACAGNNDGDATGTAITATTEWPTSFKHPGAGFSLANIEYLRAQSAQDPWKTQIDSLKAATGLSSTSAMSGPFADVSRTPDVNLGAYKNDMQLAYNLALKWLVSGDETCARRATEVMQAWATTHVSWSGAEPYLTASDYVNRSIAACEILRGTYSGWTEAHTTACQTYFSTVYWGMFGIGIGNMGAGSLLRSANQGADQLNAAMAIAVFCDDAVRFKQAVNAFRTDPIAGLANSLPNGEVGDTGRDQGHAYGQIQHLLFVAEMAWSQGIDLFGELDNRLLAIMEFFADYNLGGSPAFINFGTYYNTFTSIGGARSTRDPEGTNIAHNAYVVRKGLSAPKTLEFRDKQSQNWQSIIFRRDADTTRALPLAEPAWTVPTAASYAGLTSVNVGGTPLAGSTSQANGTWQIAGSSNGTQEGGYRFAYAKLSGDFAFSARVVSVSAEGLSTAQTGLMVRDALDSSNNTPYLWQYMGVDAAGASTGTVTFWRKGQDPHGYYASAGAAAAPYWLRLVRRGKFIYAYNSVDGQHWSAMAHVLFDTLPDEVYVGLVTLSNNGSALNTATFDNVMLGKAASSLASIPAAVSVQRLSGGIQVGWNASTGAISYDVLRADAGSSSYATVGTRIVGTRWVDTSASTGTAYSYCVRAASFGGLSDASAAAAIGAG